MPEIEPRTASRLARVLALCVLVMAATGATALPARARSSAVTHSAHNAQLLGVNIGGVQQHPLTEADAWIGQARELHAKVVRTDVPWSNVEPDGPGMISPTALAFIDRLMKDAAAARIRVIMSISSSPCWASAAPAALVSACSPGESDEASDWPPRNPADFAAFAAYLAGRYVSALTAIEVWNEPDHINERYFAGPEKVRRYAALLRAAYPAIKHANPHVAVLAGSLVGSDGVFLDHLYAAGIKGFYDGLAVHYYDLTLAAVRSIRAVQLAHGDSKPLWLDEFGWSSCYPSQLIEDELACVTEAVQAQDLTDMFHALARVSYLAAVVSYKLQDSARDSFGVLSNGGAQKPSFHALARVFASPFGAVSRTRVSMRRRGGQVIVSGSAPPGDYMQLEAFRNRTLRYKARFVLDRFNRFALPLPRVLGASGLSVRVYQLGAGPSRAGHAHI
jgi:polysaccharide biosynthesis protein PslG